MVWTADTLRVLNSCGQEGRLSVRYFSVLLRRNVRLYAAAVVNHQVQVYGIVVKLAENYEMRAWCRQRPFSAYENGLMLLQVNKYVISQLLKFCIAG